MPKFMRRNDEHEVFLPIDNASCCSLPEGSKTPYLFKVEGSWIHCFPKGPVPDSSTSFFFQVEHATLGRKQ